MNTYKRIINYTNVLGTMAIIGLSLTACIDENGIKEKYEEDQPTIELRLSTDDEATRATTGESAFTSDEKMMNIVDIFFYSSTAESDESALKWVRLKDKKHEAKEVVQISSDSVSVLFGTDNICKVYTVVNVENTEYEAAKINLNGDRPSISQLRELKAKTTSFAEKFNGFAMFTKEEDGDEVNYDPTTRRASGRIKVKNLASKIDIFVNFGDENGFVYGPDPTSSSDDTKWKIYQGVKNEAYLIDGVQVVPLNGWSDNDYTAGNLTSGLSGEDYFDTRLSKTNHYFKASDEKDKDTYPWVIAEPFYSYPNQWNNDALEQHQTYLMVKVNWLPYNKDENSPNAEDDIVETYYKVPINLKDGTTIKSKDKLLSNVYYRVKIHINTLGGINYGEPVELKDCSWEALPWRESRLNAEIHEIRWIEITQKQKDVYDGETYQAVLNNLNSVTLSYNTTHSIYLKKVRMWYWNFNTPSPYNPVEVNVTAYRANNSSTLSGTTTIADLNTEYLTLTKEQIEQIGEDNANGFYIDEENNKITFYHVLYPLHKNDTKKIYEKIGDKTYSPFYVEFTLAHVDKPDFEKTYKIKQTPGVYIEFSANSGTTINTEGQLVSIGRRVANGTGGSSGDNGKRFGVYINGGATYYFQDYNANDASNSLQFGGIGGTGRNENNNMYVIHVTQLSDDEILKNVSFGGDVGTTQTRDVKFHVGDPRTKFINNNLEGDEDLTDFADITDGWLATSYNGTNETTRNAFRRAPATKFWDGKQGYSQRWYAPFDDNASLTYYYPTAEGQADEQAFMIAPVFRLAGGNTDVFIGGTTSVPSEFFGTNRTTEDLKRENARRRCAALQNSGYPAGRWRLPTIGEALFFKFLQDRNVLPTIFADEDKAIWTAQYLFKFNKNGYQVRTYKATDDLHKWVRCIYDDWYWVDKDGNPEVITTENTKVWEVDMKTGLGPFQTDGDIREMFVWGDKPKNNPQEQPSN